MALDDAMTPREAMRDWEALRETIDESKYIKPYPKTDETELGAKCKSLKYKHYSNLPAGTLRDRHFACYPGSGSKWILRSFAEVGNVMPAGCINDDEEAKVRGRVPFVKTHHQASNKWASVLKTPGRSSKKWARAPEDLVYRLTHMAGRMGRAVLLIRNPYEALISFWNHDRSGTYDSKTSNGLLEVAESLRSEMFRDFVRLEIRLWSEINEDYLALSPDLLVVHYEDVKDDWRGQMARIFGYIDIEVDEVGYECYETYGKESYKRKHSSSKEWGDPFTPELRTLIEDAIERVQRLLKLRRQPPMPVEKYKFRDAGRKP